MKSLLRITVLLLAVNSHWLAGHTNAEKPTAARVTNANGLGGTLSVTTRRGADHAIPLALDAELRYYVEGGTLATATWEFHEIGDQGDWPTGIHFTLNCRIARAPYMSFPDPSFFRVKVQSVDPRRGIESNPIVFVVPATRSPIARGTIPDQLRMTDRNQPRMGSLFKDFVANDKLQLSFATLDRGTYIAIQQRDLVLHSEAAPKPANPNAKRMAARLTRVQDPFARAIEACQQTWQDYEASIHEVDRNEKKKAKIILFPRELDLKEQLERTLQRCLDQLVEKDADTLRKRATLHWLLEQNTAGWDIVAELAKRDKKMKALHLLHQGERLLREALLDEAGIALKESVQLDPTSVKALRLLSVALDGLPDGIDIPSGIDLNEPEPFHRTLPWLTITPIDPAIQALTRVPNP